MLFLRMFARSAGQVPLRENVLHNKQWHQRQQENYQPADLPAKKKTKRAENHRLINSHHSNDCSVSGV